MNAVDMKSEILAMVEFVKLKWDDPGYLSELIANAAQHAAKDAAHIFDSLELWCRLNDLQTLRMDHLQKIFDNPIISSNARYYDSVCIRIEALQNASNFASNALQFGWDYDNQSKSALKNILKKWPATNLAPKGWKELVEKYSVESSSDYPWDEMRNLYKGTRQDIGRNQHFTERLADPELACGFINSGRFPVYALVSAVYGYLVQLHRHNNTIAMVAEVAESFDLNSDFSVDALTPLKSPVLATMESLTKPKPSTLDQFQESNARQMAFANLSASERLAIRKGSWLDSMNFDVAELDKENKALENAFRDTLEIFRVFKSNTHDKSLNEPSC